MTETTRRLVVRVFALVATVALGLTTPASAKTLVLYAVYSDNVNIFDAFAGTPLGEFALNGFPSDIAVDAAGDVYVTESQTNPISTLIYEYAPNATAADFTYEVPSGTYPFLAANAAGDLTTVADSRTFVFYTHGNQEPIRTARSPDVIQKPVVALDGTAWAMPLDLHGRTVATVAPGATHVAIVHISGRFAPTGGAIAVDRHGNLLVMEGPVVTIFDGATGNVHASVPIAGTFDGYTAMELAPDEQHLFVATRHGTIAIYAWPTGGAPVKTYTIPGAGAIALGYR